MIQSKCLYYKKSTCTCMINTWVWKLIYIIIQWRNGKEFRFTVASCAARQVDITIICFKWPWLLGEMTQWLQRTYYTIPQFFWELLIWVAIKWQCKATKISSPIIIAVHYFSTYFMKSNLLCGSVCCCLCFRQLCLPNSYKGKKRHFKCTWISKVQSHWRFWI